MAPLRGLPCRAALLFCCLAFVSGYYVVTTPREWVKGRGTQVCVWVDGEERAAAGSLTLAVNHTRRRYKEEDEVTVILPPVTVHVPAGNNHLCEDVAVPNTAKHNGDLYVLGRLGGAPINHTVRLSLKHDLRKMILQTDKYLYEPGQTVKMRMLTIDGADLSVSTDTYEQVWVTSSSGTRIAQWNQVDNSAGLVHLELKLADEPEEGVYSISVDGQNGLRGRTTFKVAEYVLPRFEVTVTPPALAMATDDVFTFTVCAQYTFGQPVIGNLTAEVSNGQYQHCRRAFNVTSKISGCQNVTMTAADLSLINCDISSIAVRAVVTEEGTEVSLTKNGQVSVSRRALSFKTLYQDDYMKPNLPYTLKIQAERADKSPAAGVLVEMCAGDTCGNLTTPGTGIITALLTDPTTRRVVIKGLETRAMLYEASFTTHIDHYYSPSNSSLLIRAPEGDIQCSREADGINHVLPVMYAIAGQTNVKISVQVVARKTVQLTDTREYQLEEGKLDVQADQLVQPLSETPAGMVRGILNIPLTLPPAASPSARVLVWLVLDSGEVVSDKRELTVEKCLPNTVDLTFSSQQAQPGQQASYTLASTPASLCSLGVVDRSVELLSPLGDPFSLSAVFSRIYSYKISKWSGAQVDDYNYCRNQFRAGENDYSYYYTSYVDALKMFDESGMFIFSDLRVETRPCARQDEHRHYYDADISSVSHYESDITDMRIKTTSVEGYASPPRRTEVEVSEEAQEEPPARTDFPETWLWDLAIIPSSGVLTEALTMPDTITQWVGKAVCVHPEKGLAVSPKTNITAFTPFFLDLTLPPSLKRGETLPVGISIFNYLDQQLTVKVKVFPSPEYDILPPAGGAGGLGQGEGRVCLEPQSKAFLAIRIKPSALGEVNITVRATIDHQGMEGCSPTDPSISRTDTVIKPITVDPEGFQREKTWTQYVCARDMAAGSDGLPTWQVEAPSAIVEGSDRAWITVVGDLIALSLDNLGHLIRMPYGCGEQNMVKFAPNIFIMQYLEATNQLTPEANTKLLNFLNTGYQRQQLYKRIDGSFSGFGNADDSGSTWLTAFVLKSFAQAAQYISIDENNLDNTAGWLKKQQAPHGCFQKVGKLFTKGIKGGLVEEDEYPTGLTTYVLIALLESNLNISNEIIRDAITCIQQDPSPEQYDLALKAYALALADHPEADDVMQQLLVQAVVTKNATYWKLPDDNMRRSNSLEVEIAGYALLTMMTLDPRAYEPQARKVVKWISSQRNGYGGFYSTQDTVVALQAMALYESYLYQGDLNLEVSVSASGGLHHPFTVNEGNKLVTQLAPLPSLPTTLTFSLSGQGCAVLQSVLRYNVHDPSPSDVFRLESNARTVADKQCVTKRVTACATYLLPGKSNMAVIEVDLVSGYIPEKEDLKQVVKDVAPVKRYDVDGSKISFYIDEFTADTEVCVNFRVVRMVDVEEAKPGSVVVYDYYTPEFSISDVLNFPSPTQCRYAW